MPQTTTAIAPDINKKFRQAAADGDAVTVKTMLAEANVDIQSVSASNQYTALHWAIERANPKDKFHKANGVYLHVIAQLLIHGAKIDERALALSPKYSPAAILILFYDKYDKDFLKFLLQQLDPNRLQTLNKPDVAIFSMLNIHFNLRIILESLDFIKIFGDKKIINALSVACGSSFEVLYFKYFFNKKGIQLNVKAVDIDKNYVNDSQVISNSDQIFCADATDPKNLLKVGIEPDMFDVVIFRHPDFIYREETFKKMLKEVIPYFLKENNSLLYCSFYDLEEAVIFHEEQTQAIFLPRPKSHCSCAKSMPLDLRDTDGKNKTLYPDKETVIFQFNPEFLPERKMRVSELKAEAEKIKHEPKEEIAEQNSPPVV